MATANQVPDYTDSSAGTSAGLLVLLVGTAADQFESVLAGLTSFIPPESLIIASPEPISESGLAAVHPATRFVSAPATDAAWTLTADDFVNAYQLAEKNNARAILMLGPGSGALQAQAVQSLAHAVLTTPIDLAVARYQLPPHAGLVNSGILYPLTRALFASRVRFPLAVDLGLSLRMAERLAGSARRFTESQKGETPIWPVNEARIAGYLVEQFDVGPRDTTQSAGPDLNTILPLVTGALFSDIEAKAAYWQRFRALPPPDDDMLSPTLQVPSPDSATEIAPMLQAFRLAYTNLQEIWPLVLPPHSLLGLKRLSAMEASTFRMSDSLWARIVYDFLLAYRLRTLNRGHLLGALIPLYLAWAASHINITTSSDNPESHIEAVAAAFEAERTYMVSRWRWPDRFNP